MTSVEYGGSFGQRFGVVLLAGLPGIVSLVGYIYLTTPPSAVPAGLTYPSSPSCPGSTPCFSWSSRV